MRPWFVLLVLAGCAAPTPATDPVQEVGGWKDGDWWTYQVDDGEVTIVAELGDTDRLLVSDPELVRETTADGYGLSGVYEGYVRLGSVVSRPGLDEVDRDTSLRWLPDEFVVDATWSFGDRTGRITGIEGPNVTIRYEGIFDAWGATYSQDVGWFTSIGFPHETWTLIDHGSGYEGEAFLVERTAANVDSIATQMWTHPLGGATEFRLTYRLDCTDPGAVEFRLGDSFPVVQPIIAYQDVCPASSDRVTWHAAPTFARVELHGGQAGASPIVLGSYLVDGIRVS